MGEAQTPGQNPASRFLGGGRNESKSGGLADPRPQRVGGDLELDRGSDLIMTPPTTSPSGTAAPTSWETLVHPGDLVFDVGAGDGTTTDRLVARGARVICVEAHPTRASALRERYGVARYGGRLGSAGATAVNAPVVVVDMGLANRTGRIPTSVPGVAIQLTTLDEMIRAFGTPRYCRIDVGGDPESILDGLTVATEPVIPLLSFEFKAARIENMRRALERLTRLGYRRFNWCRAPRAELVEPAWRGARELLDDIVRESAGQGGASLRGDLFARGSDRELRRAIWRRAPPPVRSVRGDDSPAARQHPQRVLSRACGDRQRRPERAGARLGDRRGAVGARPPQHRLRVEPDRQPRRARGISRRVDPV